MPNYRVRAIVLRSRPFGEADRLVSLLAEDGRRIRAVAKGARRAKSRLAAAVQPFVRGDYLLWTGRSLDGISQAEPVASGGVLREDGTRLAAAAYVAELAESLSEAQPSPGFHRLVEAVLVLLEEGAPAPLPRERRDLILRGYEAALLSLAGYRPQVDACVACGEPLGDDGAFFSAAEGGAVCARCALARRTGPLPDRHAGLLPLGGEALAVLRRLLSEPPGAGRVPAVARLRVSDAARAELARALGAQLAWILQGVPKSAAFLDMLSPAGPAAGPTSGQRGT